MINILGQKKQKIKIEKIKNLSKLLKLETNFKIKD